MSGSRCVCGVRTGSAWASLQKPCGSFGRITASPFPSGWVLGVLRLKQAGFLPGWVCGQTLGWSLFRFPEESVGGGLAARQLKADGIGSGAWERSPSRDFCIGVLLCLFLR